jgi:hypothetical protein
MRSRRFLLVVSTVVALAVGGCASGTGGANGSQDRALGGSSTPTASPTPTIKPAELLATALTKSTGQNLTFDLGDSAQKFPGVYDATSHGVQVKVTEDGTTMDVRAFAADLYIGGLPDLKGKYLHASIAKFPITSDFVVFADPLSALVFLSAAAEVTQPRDGTFTGTLDLAKVGVDHPAAQKLADRVVKAAAGKPVKFSATVDAQGRLSSFSAELPGLDTDPAKLSEYQLSGLAYGGPAAVTKPAKNVIVEAPASFYTS